MTAQDAQELSTQLLHNVYRAFDYQSESEIYDTLAQSVEGALLEDLYLQIQTGLKMQEQGGAIARVKEITLDAHNLVSPNGRKIKPVQFYSKCRWRVTGTVEHWGHIHMRENQYEAILTVSAQSGAWKIADYEVLDEQRVRFETGLRTSKR